MRGEINLALLTRLFPEKKENRPEAVERVRVSLKEKVNGSLEELIQEQIEYKMRHFNLSASKERNGPLTNNEGSKIVVPGNSGGV